MRRSLPYMAVDVNWGMITGEIQPNGNLRSERQIRRSMGLRATYFSLTIVYCLPVTLGGKQCASSTDPCISPFTPTNFGIQRHSSDLKFSEAQLLGGRAILTTGQQRLSCFPGVLLRGCSRNDEPA